MSLKERIAALQEREARDKEHASSPSAPPIVPAAHGPAPAALRAKIAQFESKGAVPAPRGSFGMGAPPDVQPKRRAELYGNRMQPARIPSAALARPTSPFAAEEDDPPFPFHRPSNQQSSKERATSPQPGAAATSDKKPLAVPRATAFSAALDIARKAEADVAHTRQETEHRERRRSGLWLTPQHTAGGSLVPQYTGSLTPQYTGSPHLLPQNTGGSMSSVLSPPLSPLLSPVGTVRQRSPTLSGPLSPVLRIDMEEQDGDKTFVAEPQAQDERPQEAEEERVEEILLVPVPLSGQIDSMEAKEEEVMPTRDDIRDRRSVHPHSTCSPSP
ncbi:hypothetical protein B0H15DRAFT_351276 [Mycena belliarum]|uniref:Uncharacterized protein n=1 Tax=Mycena belliarum TaxID=1033014 RepID=A0AAD6XNC1_9AGAR|nr:hypothetical protein B0H15DRAFT_351276 [Mycena belliae]